MKAAVIVFPGLNRDRDMIAALTKIGGEAPAIVWHQDADIPDVDLIVIPVASPMATTCAAALSPPAPR